jgi:hypothetical protein
VLKVVLVSRLIVGDDNPISSYICINVPHTLTFAFNATWAYLFCGVEKA